MRVREVLSSSLYFVNGASVDKKALTTILRKIPYGLFIVATASRERSAAIIANWITQVSFKPPLIAIALENDSNILHLLEESRSFSINTLPSGSVAQAKRYLKSLRGDENKVSLNDFTLTDRGIPYLTGAADVLMCSVVSRLRTGDHLLCVGEIIEWHSRSSDAILTLRESGLRYER
ncbi:MAG: hypothetical protein C4326_03355 [Ignavibacteria bacterium]